MARTSEILPTGAGAEGTHLGASGDVSRVAPSLPDWRAGTRALVAAGLLASLQTAHAAEAQVPASVLPREQAVDSGGAAETHRQVRPTLSAGMSAMVFDEGGDATVLGSALRLGVGLLSIVDLTAGIEHWPSMERYTGWSYQIEASLYPLGRPAVSPYLLIGAGYFDANHSTKRSLDFGGFTHAVALGMTATTSGGIGLRLEAVSRVDAGNPDPQLRTFATFSPRRGVKFAGRPEARLALAGMIRIAGPWRFTEPGWVAKFATPLTPRQGIGLSAMLVHWRIPHRSYYGGYSWDTRSGIIGVGWWSRLLTGNVSLDARVGPSMSFMWEGPDYYTRAGAHLDVDATLEAGPVPFTVSAGWLWLNRRPNLGRRRTPGTDQHGLVLSAGIRL